MTEADRVEAATSEGQGPNGPSCGGRVHDLLRLAWTFNVVALESFGGGLGAWIRRLVVAEKQWLDEEEYLGAATLCQVLPGANQLNMAVFVGTRRAGAAGAVAAVCGLILAPALLAVLAGGALEVLRGIAPVKHMLAGMAAASAGLALSVAARQGIKLLTGPVPGLLTASTMLMVLVIRAPLCATLPTCGLAGCWWAWRNGRP